ncbi:hypothetical protein BKA65DRAFT_479850 [Rhexocercosporidium sp. MPI-PUGE-AT-0058]|nr:hypothetical protein BKA65DRAFT_479850 [Rhexocercosporidium sp. MPI-PUGE-AT-0058]
MTSSTTVRSWRFYQPWAGLRFEASGSMRSESENFKVQSFESKQRLAGLSTRAEFHPVPHATLLQWIESISYMFFQRQDMTHYSCIRDWDLVLDLDGSVENIASDIRVEFFALGSILYELISGNQLFGDIGPDEKDEEQIRSLITEEKFPEDLWALPMAPRILACWCPAFAKEMLAAYGKVVGGISAIASAIAIPVLGAVGFTAAGPLAGSAAAAWQSSIGIVQGGSICAWCQSAVMGGSAVGGILATGLGGGGVAVGATVAGVLNTEDADEIPDLKERFLSAWRNEVVEKGAL